MTNKSELDQALLSLPAREREAAKAPEPVEDFLAQFIRQQKRELTVIRDSSEATA